MSQRGRPGSSQGHNDPHRMPLEAAEALLWGKKTHDDHKSIFSRMLALEGHHKAYDERIQAAEAVAETADAATTRVVHLEQKVAAIEADEQDRPFDKWVEGEISGFKGFIENNKSVRQKQVELENKVYGLEDVVDKNRDAHRDVQILLERIARLENERINDSKKIGRLETEVERLAQEPQAQVVQHSPINYQPVQDPMHVHQGPPQPSHRDFQPVDAADETEDEDMLPSYPFEQRIQNAVKYRRRESRSPTVPLTTSPQKGREHMSARLRMMQHNSIYEPKQSRNGDRPPRGISTMLGGAFSYGDDSAPPTQIVDRRGAHRREPIAEVATNPPQPSPRKSLIVRLNTQKANTQQVKVGEDASIPRVTRSQARKIQEAEQSQPTDPGQQAVDVAASETETEEEPAPKRRKLNDVRLSVQTLPKADQPKKAVAAPATKSTKRAKSSPRKRAFPVEHDQSSSQSVKFPTKKPARTVKSVSSPSKKHTARSQAAATGPETNVVHLDDDLLPNSRTMATTSSPQKRSKVQSKVVVKAPRAAEATQLDDTMLETSSTVHVASSPRKRNAAQNKATAKPSKRAKPVQADDVTSTSSHKQEIASSPRKKNAVQPKPASKTPKDTSTNLRTLQATSSPRKKNPVLSKATSKASRPQDPFPSDMSIWSDLRLVSPKKTYSKSKAKPEVLPEVRHDTYDFIDDDEW